MRSFTHLHVASGYSLRYGADSPGVLVERAAGLGMTRLALTDRDGLYGAVKFVAAATGAGITPVLGVDLAVEPEPAAGGPRPAAGARRTPVRGGAVVDRRLPRVTVLAHGTAAADRARHRFGGPAVSGWSALCRLVSAVHLDGERGEPVATRDVIATHATGPGGSTADPGVLTVLLGPTSEVGLALLAGREDVARVAFGRWYATLPLGSVAVEVVCHDGPPGSVASLRHAAAMLRFARRVGVPAVLSGAVRHADPDGAVTVDVLDAIRRLVPLSERNLDRTTAAGYLMPADRMRAVAVRVSRAAGLGEAGAQDLLRDTETVADTCSLDPAADLGIGQIQLPEPELVTAGAAATVKEADAVLRARCTGGIGRRYPGAPQDLLRRVEQRLDAELATVTSLGYSPYFLTVGRVCDLIRSHGARVAARGSGAGSLVNHLLGISGIDPLRYGLLMERFCTPMRAELPDIDLDVESDRRQDIYGWILDEFGAERVSCVSMMDTYRVRHAVRDVGAALGMPPGEIGRIASAFPHIRARDVRHALAELPELAHSGLAENGRAAGRLELLFELVERLDALPRHVALHPCGVLLSNRHLMDRTPVQASWEGLPMSQFDKDDVEVLGLLKLDVLGIRMQSAMAHAVAEVARVEQTPAPDIDAVPLDDEPTYRLIRSTHTLGCFQIESPGQRELVGKLAPQEFSDLVVDISLFRPGPVKSNMIEPFLSARHGWNEPVLPHPSLREVLAETEGVVVFHEQVLRILDVVTGCGLARADEIRRQLGAPDRVGPLGEWFAEAAATRGYAAGDVERIWDVLRQFASFGFCKAHAAAFALPTYQSAWLKAHHPAAFLAGVLTHDPGMYPKRLILDDARSLGVTVLGLDVNRSDAVYRVEKVDPAAVARPPAVRELPPGPRVGGNGLRLDVALPDARGDGIRVPFTDVTGISAAEVERLVAGRPYHSLADVWHRSRPSRPVLERLVLAGAFDAMYGIGQAGAPERLTRRDLLLQVADLERLDRAERRGGGRRRPAGRGPVGEAADVRDRARRQSQAAAPVVPAGERRVQLALDLGQAPDRPVSTGLPEMTPAERVRAELEILGLDVSRHVVDFYRPMLADLGVVPAQDVLRCRSRSEVLVAGVKVATQTPPVRSGRRVVFLTLDDSTGPVDATFFEDVQGPYAATVFNSWLMLVRGELRRTGPRGVSLRATGAWELSVVWDAWRAGGPEAVAELLAQSAGAGPLEAGVSGPARTVGTGRDDGSLGEIVDPDAAVEAGRAAAARTRRVLVHSSGFRQSPYADIRPQGEDPRRTRTAAARAAAEASRSPSRRLWHASPGSSGR